MNTIKTGVIAGGIITGVLIALVLVFSRDGEGTSLIRVSAIVDGAAVYSLSYSNRTYLIVKGGGILAVQE